MKNISKYTSWVIFALFFIACEDPDLNFQEANSTEKGAFARVLTQDGIFVLRHPRASVIAITVEFYDEN